ncbi:GPO family capsid scaffolding protein [Glaesserella parasuis]|nr:GPO family capsid scaffolding protein [Glaesserella parasuis]
MENSKLRTGFICIATSGYSVDGRQITSQELHEMAETYDPKYYTANLWPEHRRWTNLGQVTELKAEDQPNGETKLFAVLAPSTELIYMNKHGQGLFTSIEIAPNFRNSGKNYLFGLGVTDSPASVGTTQLNFSIVPQNTQAGEFIKIDFSLAEEPSEDQMKRSFVSALKEFFSFSNEKHISENNNNNEETPMNKEQFEQLIAAFNGLGAKVDKLFTANSQPQEPEKPQEPSEQTATGMNPEQFNQLLTAVNGMSSKLDGLDKKFNALEQEQTILPTGVPLEAKDDGSIEVNGYTFNFGKKA